MNENVNIPAILKLCKPGIKLYSPAYGELSFVEVIEYSPSIKMSSPKIICKSGSGTERTFIFNGRISYNGEIMLFPSKDQRDWSLFNIPGGIKPIFQIGQVVVKDKVKYNITDISEKFFTIQELDTKKESLVELYRQGEFILYISPVFKIGDTIANPSTKEIYEVMEVGDLFYKLKSKVDDQKITSIPIKLQIMFISVKFKPGDKIKCTRGGITNVTYTVTEFDKDCNYSIHSNCESFKLLLGLQDNYEIIPEKFDINFLKVFDRVLVRKDNNHPWCISLFSHISESGVPCVSGCEYYIQCIPYEKNENLLGTKSDCPDFYKTWENEG